PRFRNARRATKQVMERAARHREPAQVVEVFLVERERPVLTEIHKLLEDEVDVLGLAVGGETHDLVLARVHLEAGVIRERRIQEAKRVRPVQLLDELNVAAAANAVRRGRPLPDTIERQDGRFFEWRGEERAGSVRLVMFGVQQLALVSELATELSIHVQLLFHPHRRGLEERAETARCDAEIRFEDSLELEKRLVVEANVGKVADRDAGFAEAVFHRATGKACVSLFPGEALFLSGG